nr:hypothetical protein [Cupriavidus gilardii]
MFSPLPLAREEQGRGAGERAVTASRANVLVLDGPTSSVDLAREAPILQRPRRHVDTTIIVSHRNAVPELADTIVTL